MKIYPSAKKFIRFLNDGTIVIKLPGDDVPCTTDQNSGGGGVGGIRLGILSATTEFGRERVVLSLPSGHAIIAEQKQNDVGCTDYLIEGPDMPADVVPMMIVFSVRFPDGPEKLGRVTGHWEHIRESSHDWVIAEYPNFEAFQEARRAGRSI